MRHRGGGTGWDTCGYRETSPESELSQLEAMCVRMSSFGIRRGAHPKRQNFSSWPPHAALTCSPATTMDLRYDHGSEIHVVRANCDDAPDLIALSGEHSVQVLLVVRPPRAALPVRALNSSR